MTSPHDLTIPSPGTGGSCACGETFEGDDPEGVLSEWATHVEVAHLLHSARLHALNERAERAAGEAAIRRLLELGVATRKVSEAIGVDDDGALMVSPTLVQRLGRDEHVQQPRRRRRA